MTMFLLEAYEHVHKDKAGQYEAMCTDVDNKIKETEPGILVHTLERVSEDDTKVVYRWLEVFRNYEDLQFHLDNPCGIEHHEKIEDDNVMCAPIDVRIYADWTEEQKAPLRDASGSLSITFAPLVTGFFRTQ